MNEQFIAWTKDYDRLAAQEGWNIFECDRGQHEIQRIDEQEKFESDAQAIMHVYDMALKGSWLHRRALFFVLREENIRS